MSKTTLQLTETVNATTNDVVAMVDISANQDKMMKKANFDNSKPYGEIYSTGGTMTVAVVDTWYLPTNGGGLTFASGMLNEFTFDSATGRLTYTGEENITVNIDAIASVESDGNAATFKGAVFINDVLLARSEQQGYIDPTIHHVIPLGAMVTLGKDDYIQTKWQNNTATDDVNFLNIHYKISQI